MLIAIKMHFQKDGAKPDPVFRTKIDQRFFFYKIDP